MNRVRAAILHVPGTNRDPEAALACELAGADEVDLVVCTGQPNDRVAAGRIAMANLVVLPGGFSFGDDLGAGRLLARALVPGASAVGDALARVIERDEGHVLGICNGFQALLKSGLLPGGHDADADDDPPRIGATLAANASGTFECRWVSLRLQAHSASAIIQHLIARGTTHLSCPVAHAEGRFVARASTVVDQLEANGQIALRYADATGGALADRAGDGYPHNPNGSAGHIAGISNRRGNVLGLMPHPENHLFALQRPHGAPHGGAGLALFEAAVACVRGDDVAPGDRA